METTTIFQNISEAIIQQIKLAENGIRVCVPWITDDDILTALIEKAKQNVHVELLMDNNEYNRAKSQFFNQLISKGSKVYLVDKTPNGGMIHHKFCTIDRETLILGSYNWSNNAKKNDENIVISIADNVDDFIEILKYETQFQKLIYKYGIENEQDNFDKANEYVNKSMEKQENAYEYYDLASMYLRDDNCEEALNAINIGISMLPYPDKNYFFKKHIILRNKGEFLDSTEYLFKFLSEIAENDDEAVQLFKKTYVAFIETINVNGTETYKLINSINQKTRANLGFFSNHNIEPHFFTFDELDIIPF
jgi:tetratricopeptide (TPR) repeat protein